MNSQIDTLLIDADVCFTLTSLFHLYLCAGAYAFLWVCLCTLCMWRVGAQEYLTELQALLRLVSETDFKLNSPEYWPAAYYNLPQQEHCLKVSHTLSILMPKIHVRLDRLRVNALNSNLDPQEVKGSIDKLQGPVEGALAKKEEMVQGARPMEGQRIHETAGLLSNNWEKLNKLYQDRLK